MKKFKQISWVSLASILSGIVVYAQDILDEITQESTNHILQKKWEEIVGTSGSLLQNFIVLFLQVTIAVAVSFAIWAWIQYLLSAGDEGKASKATKTLAFVGIGLAVALSAYFLISLMKQWATAIKF